MYELERSHADAETISRLESDLHGLIHEKRLLSEENLKLRSALAVVPLPRKALVERITQLEAQLARQRKEV